MRGDLRAPPGAIGRDVKVDRPAASSPLSDDGHAIAELNQAFRSVASVVVDGNPAARKRVAMGKDETHQPTRSIEIRHAKPSIRRSVAASLARAYYIVLRLPYTLADKSLKVRLDGRKMAAVDLCGLLAAT